MTIDESVRRLAAIGNHKSITDRDCHNDEMPRWGNRQSNAAIPQSEIAQ
jgi:hypothetical protein